MKQISEPDRRSGDDLKPVSSVTPVGTARERVITHVTGSPTAGWKPEGYGYAWFAERFERSSA
jgi:hypothetical protein